MFEPTPDSPGYRSELRAHLNPAAIALLVTLSILAAAAGLAVCG